MKLFILLFFVSIFSLWPGISAKAADVVRVPPVHSAVVEDSNIRIIFDKSDGLPYKYELPRVRDFYWGEDAGNKIEAVVRKTADRSDTTSQPTVDSITASGGGARIRYKLAFNGADAGTFEMHYALHAATIFVTIEHVVEARGFHLIEVRTPDLLTLRQEDGLSWFVYNNSAGKLVDLASAKPGQIGDDNNYFGSYPNISILPIVAMVKEKSVCTVEIQGFRNKTVLDVVNRNGNNRAMIGSFTPHYERGGAGTPDLLVDPNPICRIDFGGDYDGNGEVNWLDAAKMVRDRLPPIPSHFFDDKYPWIIMGQEMLRPKTAATFTEMETLTKRISNLIDHNPQICYIAGWCQGGHDTAYPNITKINEMLGGERGFFNFQNDARRMYNATVSFDDNYDDQYKNEFSGRFFDLGNIAKDASGNPITFNAWNGRDTSYITGMAHYMRKNGPGEARIDFTATHYGLEGALLIDGATWRTIQSDYDPQHPASTSTNLLQGKFRLFDRYLQKHKIAVASELLRFPALGHVAEVCDGPDTDGGSQYGGAGINIPFMAVAFQKSIYYGFPGGNHTYIDPPQALYNNVVRHGWLTKDAPDTQITDIYYLNYVPWFKLHNLDVLSFETGNIKETLADNSSFIWHSPTTGNLEVTYQGKTIIRGYDITCPEDDNRIAFYSATGDKALSYPLPKGVNISGIRAMALYGDHRDSVPVSTANSLITVKVEKQVPVIVYLEAEKEGVHN